MLHLFDRIGNAVRSQSQVGQHAGQKGQEESQGETVRGGQVGSFGPMNGQ